MSEKHASKKSAKASGETPAVSEKSVLSLVNAFRNAGDTQERNRSFHELEGALMEQINRFLHRRQKQHTEFAEFRQEALLCLAACAGEYDEAKHKCRFEAFFETRLKRAASDVRLATLSIFSGVGRKTFWKARKVFADAKADAVDVSKISEIEEYLSAQNTRFRNADAVLRLFGEFVGRENLPPTADVGEDEISIKEVFEFFYEAMGEGLAELRAQRVKQMLEAFAKLPDGQRKLLARMYGLDSGMPESMSKIAEREGRDASSVREQRDRAFAGLKKLMASATRVELERLSD